MKHFTLESSTQNGRFRFMNNQMWMDHSVMQLNTEPGAQKIELFVSQGLGAWTCNLPMEHHHRWRCAPCNPRVVLLRVSNHYRHLPSCHCQTKWKIDRSVTERLREPRVLHLGFQKEAEIWFRNLHCYQNLLLPWLSVLGENGNHLAQGWGRVRKVLSLFLRRKVLRF